MTTAELRQGRGTASAGAADGGGDRDRRPDPHARPRPGRERPFRLRHAAGAGQGWRPAPLAGDAGHPGRVPAQGRRFLRRQPRPRRAARGALPLGL